ncbi:MAG: helix-turn-helix domain-containing protein, partial [Halobacteria archaeon]|nr:helix-turn-helix domain-containing protein [Halobacteria archaeon]
MPWKEVKPMDEKVCFIADYLRQSGTFTDLCLRYGISRKTGYKWVNRYEQDGMDGLREQSRRPQSHPATTPYRLRQAIIELRQSQRIALGAKKIQTKLQARYPHETPPSITTIY